MRERTFLGSMAGVLGELADYEERKNVIADDGRNDPALLCDVAGLIAKLGSAIEQLIAGARTAGIVAPVVVVMPVRPEKPEERQLVLTDPAGAERVMFAAETLSKGRVTWEADNLASVRRAAWPLVPVVIIGTDFCGTLAWKADLPMGGLA